MGIEKIIKKLLSQPTEMRINEIVLILLHFGYRLVNIKGSHYHFKRQGKPFVIVPTHRKKVSRYYIKDICKALSDELNLNKYEKKSIRIVYIKRYQ